MLFDGIPMLEVQTVAFQRYPYAGGTNSCFLKASLRWRHKQLLSKGIPTLEVRLLNQPLRWRYNPTLVVQTPLTLALFSGLVG